MAEGRPSGITDNYNSIDNRFPDLFLLAKIAVRFFRSSFLLLDMEDILLPSIWSVIRKSIVVLIYL